MEQSNAFIQVPAPVPVQATQGSSLHHESQAVPLTDPSSSPVDSGEMQPASTSLQPISESTSELLIPSLHAFSSSSQHRKIALSTVEARHRNVTKALGKLLKTANGEQQVKELIQVTAQENHMSTLGLLQVAFSPLVPSSLRARTLGDRPLRYLKILPADKSDRIYNPAPLRFQDTQRPSSRPVTASSDLPTTAEGTADLASRKSPRVPLHKFWYQTEIEAKIAAEQQEQQLNVQANSSNSANGAVSVCQPRPLRSPPLHLSGISPIAAPQDPISHRSEKSPSSTAAGAKFDASLVSHCHDKFFSVTLPYQPYPHRSAIDPQALSATTPSHIATSSLRPSTQPERTSKLSRTQTDSRIVTGVKSKTGSILPPQSQCQASPSSQQRSPRPSSLALADCPPKSTTLHKSPYIPHQPGHICYPQTSPEWRRDARNRALEQRLQGQLQSPASSIPETTQRMPSNASRVSTRGSGSRSRWSWLSSNLSFSQMAREANPNMTSEELITAYAGLREERQAALELRKTAKLNASLSKLTQVIATSSSLSSVDTTASSSGLNASISKNAFQR